MTSTDDLHRVVNEAEVILKTVNRSGTLPGCMMPDGAEPCRAFQEQDEAIRAALALFHAALASSPTPDGVIKERGEDEKAERALRDGLSQVEPASGLNPSDFDPSRMLLQSFVRDLAAAVTARLNCRAGDGSAEQSWDDIAQVMCSWMVQGDQRMLFGDYVLSVLRARDEQPKAENPKGLSPQGASPIREAEAPASIVQTPSSQERGVGEIATDINGIPVLVKCSRGWFVLAENGDRFNLVAAPRPSQREG